MLEIFDEAFAIQKELFQRPIQLQTIVPEYCQQLQPDHLRKLASRLVQLKKKLNETKSLGNRVDRLMADEKKVSHLNAAIQDGKNSIGEMKTWIQQTFSTNARRVQGGYVLANPEQAKALMAAVLKWYLNLCMLWPAILE